MNENAPEFDPVASERRHWVDALAPVFASMSPWRQEAALVEGNPAFLRLLAEGPWGDGAKTVAIVEYFEHLRFSDPALLAELPRRLDLWEMSVPDGALSEETPSDVRALLRASLAYLETLREWLGPERWSAVFSHPEEVRHLVEFDGANIRSTYLTEDDFKQFGERDVLPVVCEEGQEARARELSDILVSTGLEPMARRVAMVLHAIAVSETGEMSGSYLMWTGEMLAGADGDGRKELPDTLFHETGHGVQAWLGASQEGRKEFARYVAAAALEPQTQSSYAESFRYREGAKTDDFVSESFAEDFRLYFFAPERLPDRKRLVIGQMVAMSFPTVDPSDVRRRVRSVLGNFYGRSVNDAIRPTNCENARREARYADRVASEDARDDAA